MSKKSRSRTVKKRDPKTVAFWSFMAAALVVSAGAYWVINSRTPESEYVSTYMPHVEEGAAPVPAAIFLGDSYTEGVQATEPAAHYTNRVCETLRWRCEVNGQGGTGYTNPGQKSERESVYGDRIELFQEKHPAVVVVQGSTNDSGNKAEVSLAAGAVFADLRTRYPDAKLIAIGPFTPPNVDRVKATANRDGVAEAAAANGVRFIDPIAENWFPDSNLYARDGVHPNDAGYKVFADRLVGDLG